MDLPCAANSARHVREIEGKQTIVVGCITYNTHAISAGSSSNISAVDTYVDKAIVCIDIAIIGCCRLVHVVHITSSRVGGLRQGVNPDG